MYNLYLQQGLNLYQFYSHLHLLHLLLTLLPTLALAGSETPPKGPPWQRDLIEAQKLALKKKVPIFVYFTKTY